MNILVLASEEYLTLRLLKCLAAQKHTVAILGAGPGAVLKASRHCRTYQAFDPHGLANFSGPLGAEIERNCRRFAIDVILPSGMACGFFLAATRTSLPVPTLPLPPLELLRVMDNKWKFSRLLQQHGLPFPKSRLLECSADGNALDLEFPVILKPLDLDASRGVTRCETPAEVRAHLRAVGTKLPLLAQEYIPGADVGLGLLAQAGTVLASTVQRQCADGSGVEFIRDEAVQEIGRRIIAVCGYDGIAHFDLRIDSRDGSVKVLECNPRFWASLPFCMLAGVNFADLGIRLALKQPVPVTACRPVRIAFPTRALSETVRGRLGAESRKALSYTLSDPVPNLLLGAGKAGRKLHATFFKTPKEVH